MNRVMRQIVFFALGLTLTVGAQELREYGIVLGGVYNTLTGSSADEMGLWVDDVEVVEGLPIFKEGASTTSSPSGALGVEVGVFLTVELNDLFYLRMDVNYLWKGAEYQKNLDTLETYAVTTDPVLARDTLNQIFASIQNDPKLGSPIPGSRKVLFTNHYIEVPLLLGFNITREFSVQAGPHVSFLISRSMEVHIREERFFLEGVQISHGEISTDEFKPETASWDLGFAAGLNYAVNDQFQIGFRYGKGTRSILDHEGSPYIANQTFHLVASMNFNEF